jgi:hypothetical protein
MRSFAGAVGSDVLGRGISMDTVGSFRLLLVLSLVVVRQGIPHVVQNRAVTAGGAVTAARVCGTQVVRVLGCGVVTRGEVRSQEPFPRRRE